MDYSPIIIIKETLGKEGKSDFQNHIIIFQCPAFNKKKVKRHSKTLESKAIQKNKVIENISGEHRNRNNMTKTLKQLS